MVSVRVRVVDAGERALVRAVTRAAGLAAVISTLIACLEPPPRLDLDAGAVEDGPEVGTGILSDPPVVTEGLVAQWSFADAFVRLTPSLYPFFGVLLSPMLAGAAMSLSSVSVITNALRLRGARL